MAPTPTSSRRTPTGRRRGRPPGTTNAARAARQASLANSAASEPPLKRRRFVPGFADGGGGLLDSASLTTPAANGAITVSRSRATGSRDGASPSLSSRRPRGARTRATTNDEELFGTAAAVAASVKQADDYKPREERSWEEFHPNLIPEKRLMLFLSEEVDNLPQPQQDAPNTPTMQTPGTPLNGSMTPSRQIKPASTGNTPNAQGKSDTNPFDLVNGTPTRRSRRPTRDVVSFYGSKSMDFAAIATPKTPKVLPIQNQTAKERLDLKLPSYRRTNRIEVFESKTFGQARYVDKAMSNIGYQESDHFIRPERQLIKATDGNMDEEYDFPSSIKNEDGFLHSKFGRVEYDMDEQDDMWLEGLNARRKSSDQEVISREIFEISMTKIEKEWHALEKRIPKPNPKPPQTHRPRSGSAAAVNGEPHATDEPDSRCAICDDGDCENTNAIVFCDGCNLAVHQECYGVPFIPEGQWLCRKCQSCGRGVPTCIFCPNTDGAFKQTSSSRWAHLLCAMWIPEVSLGNHTFMEPVMEVEKVPKTRWRLQCYLCNQKMGACIQCGNKNCYQAFHVTCARRAQLYLKMKTATGALAVLDGNMVLKAFCDKHCPPEFAEEHHVAQATKAAKKFYKKNMKGRIWADNHAVANIIAAQYRDTPGGDQADGSQDGDPQNSAIVVDKKKGTSSKNVWRLPSGAPVIPQAVFDVVESSLQRFPVRKRKEFVSEACRYWTLKREARRGAALLKRLQLQMDTFTSMELTRRNFAAMGPDGKDRLARRIKFAENLVQDLNNLKNMADDLVDREQVKFEAAELEQDFVDECYFPVVKLLTSAIEKAVSLDKDLFQTGLLGLQTRIEERHYARSLPFAQDLSEVISDGISTAPAPLKTSELHLASLAGSPSKNIFGDIRERRKLGKRILKAVQPQLELALKIESEISGKSYESLQKELEAKFGAGIAPQQPIATAYEDDEEENDDSHDTIMVDASVSGQITVKPRNTDTDDDVIDVKIQDRDNIEVRTSDQSMINGNGAVNVEMIEETHVEAIVTNGTHSHTPPGKPKFELNAHVEPTAPPTPPQSNGSLGTEPSDPLTDGGVLWYMKDFAPSGTSAVEDTWATGRNAAIRMLSEDLTDLDDEELKGLGMDVEVGVDVDVDMDVDMDEAVAATEEETTPRATRAGTAAAKSKAQKEVTKRRTSGRTLARMR